jgi:hypothetical protein
MNMNTNTAIKVHEIALLFLCRTATLKNLERELCIVFLNCEIDEEKTQTFYVEYENEQDAKELEKNCVEWLNY